MNYLKDKTAYLCGPIKAHVDDGIGWRSIITPRLNAFGINVLDPCKKSNEDGRCGLDIRGLHGLGEVGKDKELFTKIIMNEDWKQLKSKFWPIVRYDLRCVDHCDFVIFYYDPTVATVGSIHELVVATFEKKNILLFYNREQLKDFNPWISIFIKEHHLFHKWDDMFEYLKQVNNGVFDTSLWVI